MIQGTNKNTDETAYREIVLDSSSSLKEFSLDRKKYYRKYILHEEVKIRILMLPLWEGLLKHYCGRSNSSI